jgi:hypothetical protein
VHDFCDCIRLLKLAAKNVRVRWPRTGREVKQPRGELNRDRMAGYVD